MIDSDPIFIFYSVLTFEFYFFVSNVCAVQVVLNGNYTGLVTVFVLTFVNFGEHEPRYDLIRFDEHVFKFITKSIFFAQKMFETGQIVCTKFV